MLIVVAVVLSSEERKQPLKKWLCFSLIPLGFILSIVVAACLDPTRILLGIIRGEPFYRSRPASYWHEVIAVDGAEGKIRQSTLDAFNYDPRATRVLRACLAHPDPNVRWPSVAIFARCASFADQTRAFRALLNDPDTQVRYSAIRALDRLGPESLPAVPQLTRLARSDLDLDHIALHALWSIKPEAALHAEDRTRFDSKDWGFSVEMPRKVEYHLKKVSANDSDLHSFSAPSGASEFTVALSFVQPDAPLTLEERYELAPRAVAEQLKGTVDHNEPIKQGGLVGRDYKIVSDLGVLESRVFVVGNRVYHAQAGYKAGLLHPTAIKHFLDSLIITWRPEE